MQQIPASFQPIVDVLVSAAQDIKAKKDIKTTAMDVVSKLFAAAQATQNIGADFKAFGAGASIGLVLGAVYDGVVAPVVVPQVQG